VIGDQVDRHVDQAERHQSIVIGEMASPPSLNTAGKSWSAFEREINDAALLHLAPAILPAERDMHDGVEGPETLAAFRRPPHDHQADAREDALHAITRFGR